MKTLKINKSLETTQITEDQLEAISKYTRRIMKPEELFVFSLILCDNEIDRDLERFTKQSLEKLAELYLGKTGVFDHIASSENQSARIFETKLEAGGNKTSDGEDYFALKAFAYMVRCEKTSDLILEIDAGIKKEVSVGCAVEQILCSVCAADMKKSSCSHKKGASYKGILCYHLLEKPIDAYEWSFVAVPAQKNAGVTKKFGEADNDSLPLLEKINKANSSVNLSYLEVVSLKKHIEKLGVLSRSGEEYISDIKKDIIRGASIAQPEMDCAVLEDVCDLMDIEQLKAFQKSYQKMVEKNDSPFVQLEPQTKENFETQTHFEAQRHFKI